MATKTPPPPPTTPPTSGGSTSTSSGSSTGSSSSSTSSASSSSSSSASSGPSKSELAAQANAMHAYQSYLQSLGIPITPGMRHLIQKAVSQGWNQTTFLFYLRQTKEYARAFPGIMKPNGTLRMSESQYISAYQSAKDYAASLGRGLDKDLFGLAIKRGNSPSELKQKLQALDTMKEYRDVFKTYSDYLQARGIIKKPLTVKDLGAFIMRQGPKQWEQEWQTAYMSSQLENIVGVEVGRPASGAELSYKKMGKLVNEAEAMGIKPNLSVLAAQLSELPDAALYDHGLTRKDVVAATFSPKKAQSIGPRLERAWATHVAFATEQRANPQLAQGPRGTQLMTGDTHPQATE